MTIPGFLAAALLPTVLIAGDQVGNGGGMAEQNLAFARTNLARDIQLCLDSISCVTHPRDRKLLQQIQESLPREPERLYFRSGKKHPGFFHLGGQLKMARTGDRVGSPVYINTDLLYHATPQGPTFLRLDQAVALLIHEYGHHHGVEDHTRLDLLGARVATRFSQSVEVARMQPFRDGAMALVSNRDQHSFPQFLLYMDGHVADLSASLRRRLRCPLSALRVSRSLGTGGKPTAATFFNLYWQQIDFEDLEFEIRGHLNLTCSGPGHDLPWKTYLRRYKARFEFRMRVQKRWRIDPDSIKLRKRALRAWEELEREAREHGTTRITAPQVTPQYSNISLQSLRPYFYAISAVCRICDRRKRRILSPSR